MTPSEEKLKEEIEILKEKVEKLDEIDDCAYMIYGHPIQKLMREYDMKVSEFKGFLQGKNSQIDKNKENLIQMKKQKDIWRKKYRELKQQLQEMKK